MTPRVRWTCLVVVVANASLLVLQLLAGRLLAPFIGASLATWTAVIGMILAGISVGNVVGGRLADRRPTPATLRAVLVGGALAMAATLALVIALRGTSPRSAVPLEARILLLTFATCFPPAFVLSMLTPVAIRIALPDERRTGSVVGTVYALGTLGSLAGNFLTGFVLIAWWSTDTIVCGVTALLAVLALCTRDGGAEMSHARAPETAGETVAEPISTGLACATVFVASFCSMGLEIAASRLAAPLLGVSLYTWTGIIGVVLAGVAAGNWGGGKLADAWPRRDVLGGCLLVAGLATFWMVGLHHVLVRAEWLRELRLVHGVLLWSVMLYLPVMVLLGTISPQVTRLAVTDVAHAGRVAGRIYAWSCAGAILGTFATGFFLLRWLGMIPLSVVLGALLVLVAVPAGRMARRPGDLVAALGLTAAVLAGLWQGGMLASKYALETDYFAIRIDEERREPGPYTYRHLVQDNLVHSVLKGREVDGAWRAERSHLGYPHEQVQAELSIGPGAREPGRVLVIGGGGYTIPRWVESHLPRVTCDVVEIDPGVTEACHRWLGLPRDTKIITHNMDGRQFVQEVAEPGRYRLVMQDAVNDIAVPYHLMTQEYNDAIRRLLAPDGAYLLTVIDHVTEGRLYRAAIHTLRRTFPHVQLLGYVNAPDAGGREILLIRGADKPLDLGALHQILAREGALPMITTLRSPKRLEELLAMQPPVVLTDTYAPVDNLIAFEFDRKKTR